MRAQRALTLAERASGDLNAVDAVVRLRVAGALGVELAAGRSSVRAARSQGHTSARHSPEALQVVHAQVVAEQVQHDVLQRAAVAVGQHEAVAVDLCARGSACARARAARAGRTHPLGILAAAGVEAVQASV